jgi:hypothetical protein
MVAVSVRPPRLDLANEDLVRAHVHAVWLAGSSLAQRAGAEAGADTVAAFLTQAEPKRVERARSEALRVLGLIADTAEEG